MINLSSYLDGFSSESNPDIEYPKPTEFPYLVGDLKINYVVHYGNLEWWVNDESVEADLRDRALWDDFYDSFIDNIDFDGMFEFDFCAGILTLVNCRFLLETEYGEYGERMFQYPIWTHDDIQQKEVCISCFAPDHEVVADGCCTDCLQNIAEANHYHGGDILGIN